jgi:hypothetical protein
MSQQAPRFHLALRQQRKMLPGILWRQFAEHIGQQSLHL